MADQLLKNTCFHEIDVAGIPKNSDITRVVSVIDDKATMHTRQAGAEAFDTELPIGDKVRLFLITSYNGEVVDANILTKPDADVDDEIPVSSSDNVTSKSSDEYNEKRVNELAAEANMTPDELNEAKKYFTNSDLITEFTLNDKTKGDIAELVAEKKAKAAAAEEANRVDAGGEGEVKTGTTSMAGGKRTRRRKNHGSKRRNASNKSGRRASKQSRRRGKKQSKRHGRK